MKRRIWTALKVVVLVLLACAAVSYGRHDVMANWRTASREPVGLAPHPRVHPDAVIQVYAARAWGWRGLFGVHSWIAAKPSGAERYRVYEVIGWRLYRGGTSVVVSNRAPDARWFGAEPQLIAEERGDGVDDMIERLDTAVRNYPHAGTYNAWPGPNSNTFIAHLLRATPELRADLPPTAIGKDYIPEGGLAAKTPSGTGFQVSLFGLLGVLAGVEEGVEVNVLGLTFGVDPLDFSVKLPLAGRIGLTLNSNPTQP